MLQQLREVALLERGQALEDVLGAGAGIVTTEFGGLDQTHDPGRALAHRASGSSSRASRSIS